MNESIRNLVDRPSSRADITSTGRAERFPIVPREKLDFHLDDDIPRFWMDGDPFKTRFFDAMSTVFPVGERFFIASVREFREGISDPELLQQVRDFTRQEAQHSMVHLRYNERLKAQGVEIDGITRRLEESMFVEAPKHLNPTQRLAITSALEHFTAMMCTSLFERRELIEHADARIRAVWAWHAIEEVEHKAVAFDVLTRVAGASYGLRIWKMAQATLFFPLTIAAIMNHMLKVDGFGFFQRCAMWMRGLGWFFGRRGLVPPMLPHYFAYYRRGFHPWQMEEMKSYGVWQRAYGETGDPVVAANALLAAGR